LGLAEKGLSKTVMVMQHQTEIVKAQVEQMQAAMLFHKRTHHEVRMMQLEEEKIQAEADQIKLQNQLLYQEVKVGELEYQRRLKENGDS
jgi:SMC interacting uncharacterized protein involved in chromosome segregation